MKLEFFVPGPPVPKARARVVTSKHGKARAFTPAKTRDYERLVAMYARQALSAFDGTWDSRAPMKLETFLSKGGVRVVVTTVEREAKRSLRGDVDNYLKSISDSLNSIAWEDDRQVVAMAAEDVDGIQ